MRRAQILGTTAIAVAMLSGGGYAGAASAASAASAADTSASTLPEVVVVARKRPEKLIAVPISVQAFSADKLKADKIVDLNDLQFEAGYTFQGGVSTQGNGREFPSLVFRGMPSTYGAGSGDSGALFVDGVFISGGAASVTTADVQQIEVLKGPQNVYFGKNTFGGAINFITANPSNTFKGSADFSYSGLGSSDDVVSVQGPLIPDVLTGRLTVQDYTKGAQYHTSDGGPLGAENTKGITGTLYFTPTPDAWLRFRGHYQVDNDSEAQTGFLSGGSQAPAFGYAGQVGYGATCAPGTGGYGVNSAGKRVPITLTGNYFCGSIPNLGQVGSGVLDQTSVIPSYFATALATNQFQGGAPSDALLPKVPSLSHSGLARKLTELSLQGGYSLPYNMKLTANVGYDQSASLDIWDLDRSVNALYLNAQPIISNDLSMDVKLATDTSARVRGIVGVSYFQSLYRSTQYDANWYQGFASVQEGNNQYEKDHTGAVFGSIEGDITSYLTATVEMRYQQDTLKDLLVNGATGGVGGSVAEGFNSFLPRYTLKFHPNKDFDVYASYSEGVQPAVLNTTYANASPSQKIVLGQVDPGSSSYAPDAKIHAWEIGLKQSLFNDRVRYGIALYDDKWINQETSQTYFNTGLPGGSICGTTYGSNNVPSGNVVIGGNTYTPAQIAAACPLASYGAALYTANQATIQGVEFQASALITPKWTADLSVNYTHAVWDKYNNTTLLAFTGGISNFSGNYIARVPDWQGSFSTTYKDHFFGGWDYYAHGTVNFTGSMYESEINAAKTNPYARVNASIGFTKDNLTVEFYAVNLFNDKNWDWASRVPSLGSPSDNFVTDMGVLVQAPDRQDFGVKLGAKF